MGIVVIGAVFVDIKGYPLSTYIPGGRNAGRVEQDTGLEPAAYCLGSSRSTG